MTDYEILTIIISSIMAITSVIACVATIRAKNEVVVNKKIIVETIKNNNGVIADNVTGGITIDN